LIEKIKRPSLLTLKYNLCHLSFDVVKRQKQVNAFLLKKIESNNLAYWETFDVGASLDYSKVQM
jgi:hypothetical protein